MNSNSVSVDNLSEKEVEWLSLQRGLARELVGIFTESACEGSPTVEDLEITYNKYMAHFLYPPRKGLLRKKSLVIDPNPFVLSIGTAFGDCIVANTTLEWMIITDEFGTDVGLYTPGVSAGHTDIVTHPINLVAKRFESKTTNWIEDVYSSLIAEIRQMLNS